MRPYWPPMVMSRDYRGQQGLGPAATGPLGNLLRFPHPDVSRLNHYSPAFWENRTMQIQQSDRRKGWLNRIWDTARDPEEVIKIRRSRVRTMVTHGAAWFLFGGGALLITYLMIWGGTEGDALGVDLFKTMLPVAASIVSFWFAGRVSDRPSAEHGEEPWAVGEVQQEAGQRVPTAGS